MISIKDCLPADGSSRPDLASTHSAMPKGTLSIGRLHEVGGAESVSDMAGSATRRAHDPWAGTA